MILVDNALRARAEAGRPIRVGVLGAGFMAQGLTNTIVNDIPGMAVVAIYARKPERGIAVFEYAGLRDVVHTDSAARFEDAIRAGRPVVTEDAFLLTQSEHIDILVDAMGAVEFGARVLMSAFAH